MLTLLCDALTLFIQIAINREYHMANYIPEHIRACASEAVEQFGRNRGIDLALDESGCCYLEYDNRTDMAIILTGSSQIVTAISLITAPGLGDDRIGRILTGFNWLGQKLSGATMSWNPDAGNFVLWYSRDAEKTGADDLQTMFNRLIPVSEKIKPALAAQLAAPDIHETQRSTVRSVTCT